MMGEKETISLIQFTANYAVELMKSDDKSPEMATAIAELLKAILRD